MTWNICVISDRASGDTRDLNNALLYGSKTTWIPPAYSLDSMGVAAAIMKAREIDGGFALNLEKVKDFRDGLRMLKPVTRRHDLAITDHMVTKVENVVSVYEEMKNYDFPIGYPYNVNGFFIELMELLSKDSQWLNLKDSGSDDDIHRYFDEKYDPVRNFKKEIDTVLSQADASIIHGNEFDITHPENWDVDQAALDLMVAMSEVLLPDISFLPLKDVKILRERAKGELEPMQAEMLEFTVELRTMLTQNASTQDIAREAKNLIKTKVKPHTIELDSRIRSDIKLTAKSYGVEIPRLVGILGVGWLGPTPEYLYATAALAGFDAVNFLASKAKDVATLNAPTRSARFVVEIKQGISKTEYN